MILNRIRTTATALALAVGIGFASLAVAQAADPPQGGTLTFGWVEPVDVLDLAYRSGWVAFGAAHHMTDPLIRLDEEGHPQPWLVTEWEISDDHMEYTLHLRQDVTFHDGERFDAHAVQANVQRTLDDPDTMQHEHFTTYIDRVEVVDDYTVRIVLADLDVNFLYDVLAHWQVRPISPADIPGRSAQTTTQRYAGTGPFKFESFTPDDSLVLVRNDEYWGGAPNLERLVFRFLPELAVHTVEMMAGNIEMSLGVPADDRPLLERQGIEFIARPWPVANMLTMNVARGHTAELAVRRAIMHSVNRQEIIDAFLDGNAELSRAGVPEGTALYSDDVPMIEYDPEEAARILDEAGWELGPDGIRQRDGEPLRLHFLNPPGAHARNAEIVQEQLRQVGIDTDFEVAEGGTYGARWREGDYELSMTAQGGTSWGSFLGGSGIDPDAFWTVNQMRFSDDPEMQALTEELRQIVAEVRSTMDLDERREVWKRGQQLINENGLTFWLWHAPSILAVQPWVHGFDFYNQTVFLHDAYIQR